MALRLKCLLGLIALCVLAAAWRLAEIQWLRADEYRRQVFHNDRLEARVMNGIQSGAIRPDGWGGIEFDADAFTPAQAAYITQLIDKGLMRLRDGRVAIASGFTSRRNPLARMTHFSVTRGRILDRARRPLAWTELRNRRRVRLAAIQSAIHTFGVFRPDLPLTGIEKQYDGALRRPSTALADSWRGFWLWPHPGNDVVTTLDLDLQKAAEKAMAGRTGAAIAIDPKTGDVLAMVSNPTLPPNAPIGDFIAASDMNSSGPLLNRALGAYYPPGSTFKTVVAAAVLGDKLIATKDSIRCDGWFTPMRGSHYTIRDHDGERAHNPKGAGDFTIADAYAVSCNVAFARLGLLAGQQRLARWAAQFGFDERIPILGVGNDLEAIASRLFPPAPRLNPAQLAQTSIGQYEVRATPMQTALVAAAVANGGEIMQPRLVQSISVPGGREVERIESKPWRRAMPPELAKTLRAMMIGVVEDGTARRIDSARYQIAGKTGTAEVPGAPSHAWFIGFAPAKSSKIAVAVIVENGGSGSTAAAPIARAMMDSYLH